MLKVIVLSDFAFRFEKKTKENTIKKKNRKQLKVKK